MTRLLLPLLLLLAACGAPTDADEAVDCSRACEGPACAALAATCSSTARDADASSACADLPEAGRCVGADGWERCDGSGLRELLACPSSATCVMEGGRPECVASGPCAEGAVRCDGAARLARCEGGQWRAQPCAGGCVARAAGAVCAPAEDVLTLTVTYERRSPNASYTGWTLVPERVPAAGFRVVAWEDGLVRASGVTDARGQVRLAVGAAPGEKATVVVYAAGQGAAGSATYAVADPGLAGGTRPLEDAASPRAQVWGWARGTRALRAVPRIVITESEGSGAANVFAVLARAWGEGRARYAGREGRPVVVWLGYGVGWPCGACFAPWKAQVGGRTWDAQVWFPADADQAYWSDAVVMHELGHWAMASYGTPVSETGQHFVGVPTFPGQAWSEGWATWFSTQVRADSRYYDQQGGVFFWFDLATRSTNQAWVRPEPGDGLLQHLDENEVGAILRRVAQGGGSAQPLFDALAAAQMNRSPWARGYLRHTWRVDEHGDVVDVRQTGESSPMLADFLDALRCRGVTRAVVDAATEPTVAYPYPSESPLCSP